MQLHLAERDFSVHFRNGEVRERLPLLGVALIFHRLSLAVRRPFQCLSFDLSAPPR